MFIPEGSRKYAHTNSYNSAMTVIAQDDHVTAGAWAAYGALGSESNDPGSSPGQGKVLCP